MRIALIGDLQYDTLEEDGVLEKFADIASVSPSLAYVMGDFNGDTAEGHVNIRRLMETLGCPYEVMLGNHDVEYDNGQYDRFDPDLALREIVGVEPCSARVVSGVLIISFSVERQPPCGMRTVNAVYVSDERYKWICDVLESHCGMPTVIIAHPPVAGSGVRCRRPLHNAALDMYTDQTFKAKRWQELFSRYPQIRAWCSAHLHMGHNYTAAVTIRFGAAHVSCGVSFGSRDGSAVTRILDVLDDTLVFSTLDHNTGVLSEPDVIIPLDGKSEPVGRIRYPKMGEVYLDGETVLRVWRAEELERYYIATKRGMLWEYSDELDELTGAIVYENPGRVPDRLFLDGDVLYLHTESGEVYSVGAHDDGRYECLGGFAPQNIRLASAALGDELPQIPLKTESGTDGNYLMLI